MRRAIVLLMMLAFSPLFVGAEEAYVRVSPRDARYFELSDGKPFIPIGLNMIAPPGRDLSGMEAWFKLLSENKGNFVRIWLSSPFFDIEHVRSGQYDEDRAKRIDDLLVLARKYNIRLKLCIEHFRGFETVNPSWNSKALHLKSEGGTAENIADFFDGQASREQFKKKLAWYGKRYGNDPIVFAWELWNEINAVRGGDYMAWSETMLPELHRLFPKNMAVQSLGSFDRSSARSNYQRLALMPGNDVAQVHRYLDLGASLEACKGPVDVLAADAVRELLATNPKRPVILAESGAVEPKHTGPFKLYAKDQEGIILHDVLFAPFFAGAAGPGHIWHWDAYVAKNNLWRHFGRFATVVEGLDPAAEHFQPVEISHERLRIMGLKGKKTFLAWCRDTKNTWMTELQEDQPPEQLKDIALDLGAQITDLKGSVVRVYDPWTDQWAQGSVRDGRIVLPAFSRSIVIRVERK